MESENHRLDIINVAGLMIGKGHGDGLERALRDQTYVRSVRTVYPTPPSKSMEDPEKSVERANGQVLIALEEIRKEFGDSNAVLIGRSYGGLMAPTVACHMGFKDILKSISIEAPLHPDVKVESPKLLPILAVCADHYKKRPAMAAETVRIL